ncbi:MAG: NAD(P)H-hydrate dehydratase [Oscillospiraceae bacterium]
MELAMAAGMKAADRTAIEERGIDSLLLMERAAGFVAEAAAEYCVADGPAVLFCGPGNNGGDGVAAARLLMERGIPVRAFLVGAREKMTADTRAMERRLLETGGVLEDFRPADGMTAAKEAGVIVDALFGVGLSRELTGDALAAVQLMNRASAPVIAADIASGVSADTGLVLGEAVRAACTVTFSMAKPGHFIEPGCVYCGELRVCDIGIPADVLKTAGCGIYAIHGEDLRLPARNRLSHKGDHGKLLILGGCAGYTGAPSLCARAAVRAGAGLVYIGVPEDIYAVTAVKNDEAMPFARTDALVAERLSQSDVCVIGPGMGRSEDTLALTRYVLKNAGTRPVVADADALWALSQEPALLDATEAALVLTPHEGEFARLLGRSVHDRLHDALRFAETHDCAVVLKGHRTICAFPDGRAYVIDAGNPGMAKGGSGDVLAGIIGAMLGQLTGRRAVVTACWLHARSGDIAAGKFGEYALKAGDIIDTLFRAELEIME